MKTLPNAIRIGLAAFLISQGWAADSDTTKKDSTPLQGEWSMVSGTADGVPMPERIVSSAKRICKGDQLTVIAGGQLILKARITLDPSRKPKTIDYDVIGGPNTGKKQLGIYELDG